ncbi:MAG: aldehyde dehydrogenase family protein [Pseudomonadota bacterium]
MVSFIPPRSVAELEVQFGVRYPQTIGSLINGDRVEDGEETWSLQYPATEEVFASGVSLAKEKAADVAEQAAAAFKAGDWRLKPLSERQAIFYRVADQILKHKDELAFIQALETGIPYKQFQGFHVPRAAENFRFFADVASTFAGETYQQMERYLSLTLHEPIGVGLVVAPWNAPLALASMKIAACLITGNSCIVKPSEYTPYSVLRLAECVIEAGVPSTAVHVVNGLGPKAGAALVESPSVDAINFVGGTETGKRIMAAASGTLKKIGLELGGKSANIVLKSADFERALDGSLMSIFAGNGEQCLVGSRIMIERSIYEEFASAFVERAANLKIGDPFADDVEIGPLAFKSHYDRVCSYVGIAQEEGSEILCGGGRPEGADRGFFIEPVVARAQNNDARICQEEIFGPYASLMPIDDLDQGIELANQSDFGLVSYIWTDDVPSMMKASTGIRAGTVWVNTPVARDLRAHFGGYKQSGIGRDGLPGSIELFTEQKTVMLPTNPLFMPKLGTS